MRPTAMLGFVSHFLIATIISAVYLFASRHIDTLRRNWIVCGLFYDVVAYGP